MQFQPSSVPDEWGTTQDGQTRPRVVKRGIDDDHDEIPDGEFTASEGKEQKKSTMFIEKDSYFESKDLR